MKIIYWLPVFLLCIVFDAQAQNRSFGTLPLVSVPGAPAARGRKMEDSPKYQHALRIFEKLRDARGDYRFPVPTFALRKQRAQVASMDYESLEITLEEDAYDICMEFGDHADAAIAFLLGHELTHYYEKHAWRRGFASDYSDLPIGMQLDSLHDKVANETEADYLGGFLAYSAGYGLFDKGPEVIKALYKGYGIGDTIKGYPVLPDRIEMANRTAAKLQSLIEVYNTANLLTATGDYAQAYQYYRYILMQYQSREIYNNLGVTAILDALQYFREGELKFRFPVELDLESTASRGDGMVDTKTKLLRQALLHFDAAISMDPNYAPAYLNKACAYALLQDTARARYYVAMEAKPRALAGENPKTAQDADVLIGILNAMAGNEAAARDIFDEASKKNNKTAAYNLSVLNGVKPQASEETTGAKTERIDRQRIAEIALDYAFDKKKTVAIGPGLKFKQNPEQGENSRLFIAESDQDGKATLFHVTNDDYPLETTRGLKIGASSAEVMSDEAYKTPKQAIETPQGVILVYPNIIFIFNQDKLSRWVTFKKVEL